MREKPILFSTPMVLAILEGRKNQTRRAINPQPKYVLKKHNEEWYEYSETPMADIICNSPWGNSYQCKYKVNDILWVRETFGKDDEVFKDQKGYFYKIFGNREFGYEISGMGKCWKPSIFMPREAARIFLKVKNIKVERVQDISEKEAESEGAYKAAWIVSTAKEGDKIQEPMFRNGFANLWDKINSKRGFGWEMNPLCWVISFECL